MYTHRLPTSYHDIFCFSTSTSTNNSSSTVYSIDLTCFFDYDVNVVFLLDLDIEELIDLLSLSDYLCGD